MKRLLVVAAVLIVVAAGGYYAWSRWFATGTAGVNVQTTPLARGNVSRIISTSGTVKARVQVDVSTQLSGQISERPVDYNSIVKQGDELARLDPAPFQSKLQQLQAQIAVANAGIATATAGLQKAQINLAKAQSDLETDKALAAKGAVTAATVQTADNTAQLAQSDYASAQAVVATANANLQERQAELASAQIDLDHTYIRAPIDGIVIDRTIEIGQTVAASSTAPKLFTLAQDLSTIDIAGQVDESDVAQVAVGDPVSFHVDAFPGSTFSGAVSQVRLAPLSAQNVVTYTIVVGANNPGGRLIPGMTANLDIVTGERDNVLVVPNEALRFSPPAAAASLVRTAPGGNAPPPASAGASTADTGDVVAGLQRALGLDDATAGRIRAAFAAADQGGGLQSSSPSAATQPRGPGGGQARGNPTAFAGGNRGSGPGGNPGGQGRGAAAATPPAGAPAQPAVGGPDSDGSLTPVSAVTAAAPDAARQKTDDILRGILTADEFAKYQTIAADLQSAPPIGALWVRQPDGTITRHAVQLGLASLNTTEIAATDIPEGAAIVLRVREARR